ncbi:OVARIAN TUMOR DOMAIN-containing deubiquitinating enzyme 7 isoform X2 [Euphorbia lathyris]|uniref:OVARIAN TUMOR DOMAIN-containing deubiquitinating enzyme 7 isoform X2 n=1 Tax=Euphorbia lathyris TaxID=212925 RepID=UPI0033143AC5
MVKTRQQKSSKPKKNSHAKKHGKQADITQFQAQVDALGLKIIQVTADGNCFFRALADQLDGSEDEHGKYRSMVVKYIMNREMFEPFIEDEIPFDEYCQSMEKDGTWAGHMELQAASLVTRSNICIHQYTLPRWYIRNFDQHGVCMVHLSYHDEEHYNSVRLKEDTCNGPARPIIIKADGDLPKMSKQAKAAASNSKVGTTEDIIDAGSIKLVMAGSGCDNAEKVEQVLLQVDGDVGAAIEVLVAEQEADDYDAENDALPCHADTSHEPQGVSEDRNSKKHNEEPQTQTQKHDSSNSRNKITNDKSSSLADDKIPRNKNCPCGSKKKYKACCGTVKGRPSAKFAVSQNIDTRKGRKVRKQQGRGPAGPEAESGVPDVGALCI